MKKDRYDHNTLIQGNRAKIRAGQKPCQPERSVLTSSTGLQAEERRTPHIRPLLLQQVHCASSAKRVRTRPRASNVPAQKPNEGTSESAPSISRAAPASQPVAGYKRGSTLGSPQVSIWSIAFLLLFHPHFEGAPCCSRRRPRRKLESVCIEEGLRPRPKATSRSCALPNRTDRCSCVRVCACPYEQVQRRRWRITRPLILCCLTLGRARWRSVRCGRRDSAISLEFFKIWLLL